MLYLARMGTCTLPVQKPTMPCCDIKALPAPTPVLSWGSMYRRSAVDWITPPAWRSPEMEVFVASGVTDSILRYAGPDAAEPGAFLGPFISTGSGGLDAPHDLHIGEDGYLYVSSGNTDNILRYQGPEGDEPGRFVDEYILAGSDGLDILAKFFLTMPDTCWLSVNRPIRCFAMSNPPTRCS